MLPLLEQRAARRGFGSGARKDRKALRKRLPKLIRELVGGLYFGTKTVGVDAHNHRYVEETLRYDEIQIKQILKKGLELAQRRKGVLHNIHKSNVLKSSVLWNEVLEEMAPKSYSQMYRENMFGDILSDQGGGIIGSLGLMPSACIGDDKAYYEPSHGSAPDIAGKNIANPYSMIGSAAMMLEYSFGMAAEARNIWMAMQAVFADGFSTPDLTQPGVKVETIGTEAFGDKVVAKLRAAPRVS